MIEWFEADLDKAPEDWATRLRYAAWLEGVGLRVEAKVQRWLVENQKTPGPACVMEAEWFEASWFIESSVGQKWGFPNHETYWKSGVLRAEWCLPTAIYSALTGFITHRRDHSLRDSKGTGFHNQFAKSWKGRRLAEAALVDYARGKICPRTLDTKWDEDEYDIPKEFR